MSVEVLCFMSYFELLIIFVANFVIFDHILLLRASKRVLCLELFYNNIHGKFCHI